MNNLSGNATFSIISKYEKTISEQIYKMKYLIFKVGKYSKSFHFVYLYRYADGRHAINHVIYSFHVNNKY